jgi:hypothetical protein
MPAMNPGTSPTNDPLLQVAGGLGAAGVAVAITVTLAACGGIDGALVFGLVPVTLGISDLVLIVIQRTRSRVNPDAVILAAAFGAILSIVGGLAQIAAWRHWPIVYQKM